MRTANLHLSLLTISLGVLLAGCGTLSGKTARNDDTPITPPYKGGGYYKDDGPGAHPPKNLSETPDAVPKVEPLHRYANDTYQVMGKEYVPISANMPYERQGLASWYGRKFHGRRTASGESYDMYAMTAAHATLPIPSYARVTNQENGRSVLVRINDRGPFHEGRIIDLSYTAAYKLDILKGVTPVIVELVQPGAAPTSFLARAEESVPALPAVQPAVPATVPAPRAITLPAPAVAQAAPAKTGSGAVYLQMGAFSNPDTAEALLARLTTRLSAGLPGAMRLETNGLHKVQVGPYASAEEADRAAARLQDELGLTSYKVIGNAPSTQTVAAPATVPAPAIASLPAPPAASADSLTAPAPGLYLQLAAVSSPPAAEALATRVKARFGADIPGLTQVVVGNLVKLQVGPFTQPAAAEQLATAYEQDFGIKPYRVVRQ